jgi:hypothetical protein
MEKIQRGFFPGRRRYLLLAPFLVGAQPLGDLASAGQLLQHLLASGTFADMGCEESLLRSWELIVEHLLELLGRGTRRHGHQGDSHGFAAARS